MEKRLYSKFYELEDRHWWFTGRRAVVAALLRRGGIARATRVLDVGCGTGRNLQELARLGPVVGVDPAPEAVEFCRARRGGEVYEAWLPGLPFESKTFDVIVACDVLEHLHDDGSALDELHRVATAGATLVATVPAYRWLWSGHDRSHHHRRRYTRTELTHRARERGWAPVCVTYFNTLLLPPIALARLARRKDAGAGRTDYELTPPSLDRALELPMRLEAALIARGVQLPAGVSLGLVATARR